MMSFDWQADDILRVPSNAEVEYSVTEQDGAERFSLVKDGDVCAVVRFMQNPPWLARFLRCLSEAGFPPLTIQDWLAVLGIAPAAFFATLNVLLQSGFIVRPQRGGGGARRFVM